MILDKIEVSYPRAILKYRVKFAESRKPTYIEFILLQILISYADKEQTLKKILEGELGIGDTSLFKRAMRDLLNFNIVQTSVEVDEKSFEELLDVKLVDLNISDELKNSFRNKSYMISNIVKTLELKYVYDPLTKRTKIFQRVDWEKKQTDSQCVYKLFQREDIEYKMQVSDIKRDTIELMQKEPELFGENCEIIDVELLDDTSLDEISKEINIYYDYENISYRTLINFSEKKYVIDSESTDLLKYFSENKRLESEFITFVFDTYNKKIGEVIKGKKLDQTQTSLDDAVLLQDFPSKTKHFDFLFFNFNDLNSRSKFLERPKYIENSDIIFEYNINGDEVRIGFERKKILVATHKLKNLDVWKGATIVYANFQKNIEAYNVEQVYVPSLKEYVYVARALENFRNDLNVDLGQTFEEIREVFYTSLKFGDYDKVALCIGLLFKLDEKQIVEKIMNERIAVDLLYAREYTAIRKSLVKYNLSQELLFIEELVTEIILASKDKFTSEEFLKILPKYNISSKASLLHLTSKINFNFDFNELVSLNTFLEKQTIDGWKLNVNNSLVKFLKHAIEADHKNIYNNNTVVITNHLDFVDKYKTFVAQLNANTPYNEIVKTFVSLYRAELNLLQSIDPEMQNKIEYVDLLGKLLNTPLKVYKNIITGYMAMSATSKVTKLKQLALEYITSVDDKIVKLIRPNTISESFEINKTLLKLSNDAVLAEEIVGDEFKLNDCLEIYYTYLFETDADTITKKFRELEGNENE
jgi:hypothetical protein